MIRHNKFYLKNWNLQYQYLNLFFDLIDYEINILLGLKGVAWKCEYKFLQPIEVNNRNRKNVFASENLDFAQFMKKFIFDGSKIRNFITTNCWSLVRQSFYNSV